MSNFSGFDLDISISSVDYYSGDFSGDDFNITNNITKLCEKNCEEYIGNDDIIVITSIIVLIVCCILSIITKGFCDWCICLIPCYIITTCYSFKYVYRLYKEKQKYEKSTKNYIVNYLNKLEQNIGFDCHCAICLEELNKNIRTLPCGHSFHNNCIHSWLKKGDSKVCPVCREPLYIPLPEPRWTVVDYSSDSSNGYDD